MALLDRFRRPTPEHAGTTTHPAPDAPRCPSPWWTSWIPVLTAGMFASPALAQSVGTTTQPVVALESTLWEDTTIPVCWENPGNFDDERGWTRDAIENTWEAVSPVDFTGWGTCRSDSQGVRIRIEDDGNAPHVDVLGNRLDGRRNGMSLNFTFENWSETCADSEMIEFCIRTIAVHEFGHALGLAHEHNRADAPFCGEDPQGTDGDFVVTPYDLDSVMNYCNPQWAGNGQLSALDIQGIQELYGMEDGARARVFLGEGDGVEANRAFVQGLGVGFSSGQRWLHGDFDGDGNEDLALVYGHSTEGATAMIFSSTVDGYVKTGFQRLGAGFWDAQRWETGDFTGDGRDDLLLVYGHSVNGATAWIYRSNGDSFTRVGSQRLGAGFWDAQRWETGDFTGDGRDDLMLIYGHSKYGATGWLYRSNGASFTRIGSQRMNASFNDQHRWEVGDFNGDGRDDLELVFSSSKKANAWVYRSSGSSFSRVSAQGFSAGFWSSQRWETGDFDDDGRDDLMLIYAGPDSIATSWTYRSTGSAFTRTNTRRLGITFRSGQQWLFGDFDGSGEDDAILVHDH